MLFFVEVWMKSAFAYYLQGGEKMQPFLKWPGGKRWLLAQYPHIFPQEYNVYYEPFLGGGSAFFHLMPNEAVISDINPDLINVYRMMCRHPDRLRNLLDQHRLNHSNQYYYDVRGQIPRDRLAQAARFLYLNRTCFNGMYRVNQQGQFNVPVGTRECFVEDVAVFQQYAQALQNAEIGTHDFVETIRGAGDGDLVFADPPYTIAHNQNSFIKYNENLFSWKDQKRLLNALTRARDRQAIIIATNAMYPELEQMYRNNGFYTQAVSRFSSISGNAVGRGRQEELLISSQQIDL